MHKVPFWKYVAAGNDFILVEEDAIAHLGHGEFAQKVCDRNFGVGSDGLIVLGKSKSADTRMYFFNPDGTPDVCGNGMRCVALHIYSKAPFKTVSVETDASVVQIEALEGGARIKVQSRVIELPKKQSVKVDGVSMQGYFINTGTPHFVVFADENPDFDVARQGPLLEHHQDFTQPVSVDFVSSVLPGKLSIRIWERSVGETLSCGTGASASAICAALFRDAGFMSSVHCRGGVLNIEFDNKENFTLAGNAELVFRGTY